MPATPLGRNITHGRDDWSSILIEALGLESAVALGGVRFLPCAGKSLHVPRVLVDPDAQFVDELEELPDDSAEGDTMVLTPRKVGSTTTLSTESIEDSPISELDAVGRSLVRGVAKKIDSVFFSNAAETTKVPAGILNGTLPGATGEPNIVELTTAVGAVEAAGGQANVIWIAPADITEIRLEVLAGGYQISDPTSPGVERIAGARLVPTKALTAGTAIVADSRYIVAAVRRDARVDWSEHSRFSVDGVQGRVTMRVDWEIADATAVFVVKPV